MSLLAPLPLPPNNDDNADDQRSGNAARDPLPENDRCGHPKSPSLLSLPSGAGGCVRGAEHQRPVAPKIVQPLGQVPPQGHPSLS